MKLLVISNYWVEPRSTAAGARMLQLLLVFLEKGWEVHYATTAAPSPYAADLTKLGIHSHTILMNDASFDTFVIRQMPEFVLYDRFMAEEQFGWRIATHCPEAMTLLDTEDLHCLRNARNVALRARRSYEKNDLVSDIAKREIASIYRCDLTLMISEYEMQLLETYFKIPKDLLYYLPFILDHQALDFTTFEEREHFVFIGNFLHGPNRDAVTVLKNHIWPLIREELPKAQLHIYGAYLPDKIAQLHQPKTGFLIKGRAEDASTVIRDARVLIAPLRYGAGLKGKLIDAMCAGTPSVTTDIGAEGISGDYPWPGQVVPFSEEEEHFFYTAFARASIDAYTQKGRWSEAQTLGVQIINKRFQKTDHAAQCIDRILEVREMLNKHRETNFIGQMLQFHKMRSTEFMSRWIEIKNKSN